jgi:non-heme chloroperoxidase
MGYITAGDGTQISFKDWGEGPVVTFSHGWPLNADAWDGQLHFLAKQGYRVIAHGRRGHGRSSQPSERPRVPQELTQNNREISRRRTS